MFTGIIEATGKVVSLQHKNAQLHIAVESKISFELKIDQSVSHNGVCLTVIRVENNCHEVIAVEETLLKSNLKELLTGDIINLERSIKVGDRLDGHFVQGHVDATAKFIHEKKENENIVLTFGIDKKFRDLIVEKGSIALNGISFTLVDVGEDQFSIAVIPYTWENTNLSALKLQDEVNIEFDVIGKYVARMMNDKR